MKCQSSCELRLYSGDLTEAEVSVFKVTHVGVVGRRLQLLLYRPLHRAVHSIASLSAMLI